MLGNYSKLIGAVVGNVVAIVLAWVATKWTGIATCAVVDGVQTCTALGLSQAQITAGLMAIINSAFVYFFPPNRETMRMYSTIGILILTGIALSSCTLSASQQTAVARAYDRTCAAEPPIYQSFVLVATAKGASERTMKKAETIHLTVSRLCADRPTDIASAAVTLAALYAQLVTISAQVERS
jgi:hypothetical protein